MNIPNQAKTNMQIKRRELLEGKGGGEGEMGEEG